MPPSDTNPPPPEGHAFGAPGIPPSWTSSDKDLVGTAMGSARVWFALGHGIVNEVYYPRIDIPQIRDLGFIVGDGEGFWVEVKRLRGYALRVPAPGIPVATLVHRHPRFTLTLTVCPDAARDVLLIDLALEGDSALGVYALLAPHLGGTGRANRAWASTYRGSRVLWAEQGPFGLALAAVGPDGADGFASGSAGYVGASDGWQDFRVNGRMAWHFESAGPGNVALMGRLAPRATLALGFAATRQAAATLARAALTEPFARQRDAQIAAWRAWHAACGRAAPPPDLPEPLRELWTASAQVLKTHADKTYLGAMVASLSVPWGDRGEERGGYHLVWPRDLVESAQALIALGGLDEARAVLGYLIATQNADGGWYQNQWLGGRPYWHGVQLDEAAFPVLLAAALAERGALRGMAVADCVRRALAFLVRNGPASPQDRWEEDAGVNAFTLGVCVAALVAGADLLPESERALPLAVADYWNARIEDWCVARDTAFGRAHGVAAYYVRVAPPDIVCDDRAMQRALPVKNRGDGFAPAASEQVALDFLQLVRLGLRRAADPVVADTVRLADALLKADTPAGPVWRRYNGDGYGEHDDGRAFDGLGRGRGWPLLTGERGHYALAAGDDPLPLLTAMHAMARRELLPEQVWDTDPVGALRPGRPTGGAMPLVWAHAEFVKLAASRAAGRPLDRLDAVWARYRGERPLARERIWTPAAPIERTDAAGLWIVLPFAATLHLGFDGWRDARDVPAEALGLGLHGVRLGADALRDRACLDFTWRDAGDVWHAARYRLAIVPPPG